MADDRYNRWQGHAIAQLSVAIALISGLSVAGIGAGVATLQENGVASSGFTRALLLMSMFLLVLATLLGCCAVIARLLDFRLTARVVRNKEHPEYSRPLTLFRLDKESYGRATWALFWAMYIAFMTGGSMLIVSIAAASLMDKPAAIEQHGEPTLEPLSD